MSTGLDERASQIFAMVNEIAERVARFVARRRRHGFPHGEHVVSDANVC
jgi:hypothetical protein